MDTATHLLGCVRSSRRDALARPTACVRSGSARAAASTGASVGPTACCRRWCGRSRRRRRWERQGSHVLRAAAAASSGRRTRARCRGALRVSHTPGTLHGAHTHRQGLGTREALTRVSPTSPSATGLQPARRLLPPNATDFPWSSAFSARSTVPQRNTDDGRQMTTQESGVSPQYVIRTTNSPWQHSGRRSHTVRVPLPCDTAVVLWHSPQACRTRTHRYSSC